MIRSAVSLLLLAFPLSIAAQDAASPVDGAAAVGSGDAEGDEREVTIVLEEQPKSVKEAMERREAKLAIAQKELDAAQKIYDENQAAIDRLTVTELAVHARLAVAEGMLSEAAEAWAAVEQLDPENEQAKAFFKVVGRDEAETKKPTILPGDNRRVWISADNRIPRFVMQRNGTWVETKAKKQWLEASRSQHTIELQRPAGERLRIHGDSFYWMSPDGRWNLGTGGSWGR